MEEELADLMKIASSTKFSTETTIDRGDDFSEIESNESFLLGVENSHRDNKVYVRFADGIADLADKLGVTT